MAPTAGWRRRLSGPSSSPSTSAVCSPTSGAVPSSRKGVGRHWANAPGTANDRSAGRCSTVSKNPRSAYWALVTTSSGDEMGAISSPRAIAPSSSSRLVLDEVNASTAALDRSHSLIGSLPDSSRSR